jgi:hypothetical protein
MIDIREIKAKLETVRRYRGWTRDEIYSPMSEAEIRAFEEQWQIELPHEYRTFLLEVGPALIAPLDQAVQHATTEMLGWLQEDSAPLPADWFSKPYPFIQKFTSILPDPDNDNVDLDELDAEDAYLRDNLRGAIMLDEEGCAIYDFLVVSGSERGNVWVDDRANSGEIYPDTLHSSNEDKNQRVTFFEWYMHRLDQFIPHDIK